MPSPRVLVAQAEVAADGRTCARCGADKDEARKYRIRCEMPYWRHMWKWSMDDA